MPVIQTEIRRVRSCTRENRLVEALTDTMMSNIGTNRKANSAVLCDTDTEAGDFCGNFKLNPLPG